MSGTHDVGLVVLNVALVAVACAVEVAPDLEDEAVQVVGAVGLRVAVVLLEAKDERLQGGGERELSRGHGGQGEVDGAHLDEVDVASLDGGDCDLLGGLPLCALRWKVSDGRKGRE